VILFVIPCLLPRRWLCVYVPLAAIGISALWWDYLRHRYDGNAFAQAFTEVMIASGTAGAIAGLAARLIIMVLRAWRVRWRYAWLPAPLLFALLIAAPWLMEWYGEFERRPPSDECMARAHRLELAGAAIRVPLAPVFTVFRASGPRDLDLLSSPADARAFCRRTAAADPLPIRLLKIDLQRNLPNDRYRWDERLCAAVRDRPWLHRFCSGPVSLEAEHYPARIDLAPAEDVARTYRDLWQLYRAAATGGAPAEQAVERGTGWRLRAADGTAIAAICRPYGDSGMSCAAVFEPHPGLAAQFEFAVERARLPAEIVAIQARTAEIVHDLLRP
jgi:hypothetical protein